MTEEHIGATLSLLEGTVEGVYYHEVRQIEELKALIKNDLTLVKQDVCLRISVIETRLVRSETVLAADADYHLLRAYFHASPSLIAIITAIYSFITTVVSIVKLINDLLMVITGETLAYWLDQLWPGFQAAWNKLMNNISEFSRYLGWGVDGVLHLMNVSNAGLYTAGALLGKDISWTDTELYKRLESKMGSFSQYLAQWQSNPGQMIANEFRSSAESDRYRVFRFMENLTGKLDGASEKVEKVAEGLGTMTSELLAMRSDMPAVIAKNIPQALWDGITWADAMINDRLLPRLDALQERLDELDALLDKYAADTRSLAGRIARPGDLLAEIASLPDYIRRDQEDKIDSVTSGKLARDNAAAWEAERVDLSAFSKVYAALTAPLPPPEFMLIEGPARMAVTGIVAEPRETWIVGDF